MKNWILVFLLRRVDVSLRSVVVLYCLALVGCETTQLKQDTLEVIGSEVAFAAIKGDPENWEKVQFVVDSIDALLDLDSVLFGEIEEWYKAKRQEVELRPLTRLFLERTFIFPLWDRLKAKYGGATLDLKNPAVIADIRAFQKGLRSEL